jgi:hypothetical protein
LKKYAVIVLLLAVAGPAFTDNGPVTQALAGAVPALPSRLVDPKPAQRDGAVVVASDCALFTTPDPWDRMQRNFRRIVPDDCAVTHLAPPRFIWTEPRTSPALDDAALIRDPRQPFEITVRRGSETVATRKTLRTAVAFLSTDAAWSAGDYNWTIALITKKGQRLESSPRRFRIAPGAVALDWPDGKALAAQVAARPFPRGLATGLTWPALKDRIASGDARGPWDAFEGQARERASTFVHQPPKEPVEAARFAPHSPESVAAGVALQNPVQNEQRAIQSLVYAYRLTADYAYRDAALARMRNLARWSVTGPTVTNPDFDLANRAIYRALAEGLDVLWDRIDPAERDAWVSVVRKRMQPILKAFDGWDTEPYNSHLVGETAIAVETLLHVAGMPGFPEAQDWLAEAWERYRFGFDAWGGEDGGFANGIAYGWHTLDLTATANAALRVIAGVDMGRHPYFAAFGRYPMAFVAPAMDGLLLPFGDQVETTKFFAWNVPDAYRLHADLSRDPQDGWYWRANPTTTGAKSFGRLSPWHFLMRGLDLPPVKPREPQETAYLSRDAGIAAVFSKISDPKRSALYLRASRYGSVSHSHADQNSIAFDSHGQNLLISSGYYPWYGSAHHMGVTRLTRFKNALTIDGGIGQNETVDDPTVEPKVPGPTNFSMDNRGEIVGFVDGPRWGVVTGDASNAWRPRRRAFPYDYGAPMVDVDIRSAAYDRRDRVAVIYDQAHSAKPRRWELNFHALAPFDAKGAGVRIDRKGVALCIEVYGPGGAFETSKGFPIPPEKPYPSEQYPEQYHARFTAAQARPDWTSVAVLREDCASHKVEVRFDGARATVGIDGGAAIVFDGRRVEVPQ